MRQRKLQISSLMLRSCINLLVRLRSAKYLNSSLDLTSPLLRRVSIETKAIQYWPLIMILHTRTTLLLTSVTLSSRPSIRLFIGSRLMLIVVQTFYSRSNQISKDNPSTGSLRPSHQMNIYLQHRLT